MKKIAIAIAVLVVLLGVAIMFIGSNLDGIARAAIVGVGSKALGVEVGVGGVELALAEGSGTIRDLSVANPPGYGGGQALQFGELTLSLDTDAKAITLIRVAGTEINAIAKDETNNFEELLGGLEGDAPAEESEAVDEDGEPVSMRIDRIEVEAARATLESPELEEPMDLQIDELVFTDLEGTGEQIAGQIFGQLLAEISGAIKDAMRTAVEDAVEEAVDQKKEEAKEGIRDRLKRN
jgi:hypothetical protein